MIQIQFRIHLPETANAEFTVEADILKREDATPLETDIALCLEDVSHDIFKQWAKQIGTILHDQKICAPSNKDAAKC